MLWTSDLSFLHAKASLGIPQLWSPRAPPSLRPGARAASAGGASWGLGGDEEEAGPVRLWVNLKVDREKAKFLPVKIYRS